MNNALQLTIPLVCFTQRECFKLVAIATVELLAMKLAPCFFHITMLDTDYFAVVLAT